MIRDPGAAVERIHAFDRETLARVAEEVVPIPEGWVARARSSPDVWALNHVGVTEPVSYADALEVVERRMADLPYRHLVIQHQASGEQLDGRLRSDGWKVERNVLMALRDAPSFSVDTSPVAEVSEDEVRGLMWDWTGEGDEDHQPTPEEHEQILEASCRIWRARQARHLAVRDGSGRVVGITMLFSDGATAQVEDVYVDPAARGRGYGRVLVTRAVELALEAGHEFTFIVADDEDWPKQVYAKVGFEPVGLAWEFHRPVRASG